MTKRANRKRGFGRGLPMYRADMHLIRRAVRERWPVPVSRRPAIVDEVVKAALGDDTRMTLAGASACFEMHALNVTLSKQHLANFSSRKPDTTKKSFHR